MAEAHHTHGDEPSSYYLDQLFMIGVCGAIAGVTIVLWQSNLLGKMLHPKFHIWVALGGISLLTIVVLRAIAVWQSVDASHDADHTHEHGPGCGHTHGHGAEGGHTHGHEHHVQPAPGVQLKDPAKEVQPQPGPGGALALAVVAPPAGAVAPGHSHAHGHSHSHGHDHEHAWAP